MIMLLKIIKLNMLVEKIKAIVIAEHCRRNRVEKRYKKIIGG